MKQNAGAILNLKTSVNITVPIKDRKKVLGMEFNRSYFNQAPILDFNWLNVTIEKCMCYDELTKKICLLDILK
jgi:hypothetical protein